MKFLKTYSYEIIKLFINQVGITIFSLVLSTAVAAIEDDSLYTKVYLLVSVFAVMFYLCLLYTVAWDYGARDKIKIDGGKLDKDKLRGLKMSLLANIPNFLLAFISVLFISLYIFVGAEWLNTVFALALVIVKFTNAMFLGIINGVFSFAYSDDVGSMAFNVYNLLQSIGYLVAPLLAVLTTHLGYSFGSKDFRIFSIFSKQKNK